MACESDRAVWFLYWLVFRSVDEVSDAEICCRQDEIGAGVGTCSDDGGDGATTQGCSEPGCRFGCHGETMSDKRWT